MVLEQLATSFLLGILSSSNPCLLPLFPGFLAYLATRSPQLGKGRTAAGLVGLVTLAGVLVSMLALGALAAAFVTSATTVLLYTVPVANGLLVLLGLVLLLNLHVSLPQPRVGLPRAGGAWTGAFAYGLLYGPIALPCNAPLAVSVFAFSANAADFGSRLLLFAAFGLGMGVPLLALALLAGAARQRLVDFIVRRQALINRVAGALLLAAGLYGFWYSAAYLQLFLR